MKDLYQLSPGELAVWITPRANINSILDWVAFYTLRGSVGVLDSGYEFDHKQLISRLRRRTDHLTETLTRIRVYPISTCFQLLRVLEETRSSNIPHIALDFLATFFDESVPVAESYHLLGIAIGHLHRLRKYAPFVVCIHPARIHQSDRDGLAEVVLAMADHVFTSNDSPPDSPTRLLW